MIHVSPISQEDHEVNFEREKEGEHIKHTFALNVEKMDTMRKIAKVQLRTVSNVENCRTLIGHALHFESLNGFHWGARITSWMVVGFWT